MADKKELDRVNQVASLIDRYYQFEDAVDVNKQNILTNFFGVPSNRWDAFSVLCDSSLCIENCLGL